MGKLYAKWNTAQRITALIGQILAMVLAVKLAINGEITVGSLALIFIFSNKIFMLADYIVYSLDTIFRSASEFNAASKILNEKSKIKDDKDAKNIKITEGKITFNNVSFNYENNKVFSKFNLEIKSGETVGIVGKSGSGKTTLVKLLYRMYDLDNGYISIDKQNIRHVKQNSIRNSMSLVPQETLLFDDTIYNNVKFANAYSNYQDVINALKKAELWEFIKKLPDKEKTIVGERGIKLSGGEKQRIAIARSILANKKIIILDEATSSLDSETESKIRDTLDKLTKGKTTIIIAHRLSTVMNADKIVVFSEGEIVEVGTHKQLLKKKGKYSELWKYQSQGFI
jgi:ATP-binding cassette subfamily B protein